MSDDDVPGGRAGRRRRPRRRRHCAPTPSSTASRIITRTLPPFEVLTEEGLDDRSSRTPTRSSSRSGSTSATRPTRTQLFARRRRGRARASACASRAGCAGSSSRRRRRERFTQYARNPREQRRDRRHAHRARPRVRLAVRPRPGRRSPLRHDRGLPELREARLHGAVPASLGRHRVRARRPAGQQAALRHGLRAHAVLGQAVHGLGHPPAARAGHGRHGADPVRRRLPRGHTR